MSIWSSIGKAVPAIGNFAGGLLGITGQQKANQENKDFAREQWDKSYEASNTAVSRRVKDIKKAGLSVSQMYSGMQGAGMPSSLGATIGNENTAMAHALPKGINDTVAMQSAMTNIDSVQTNTALNKVNLEKAKIKEPLYKLGNQMTNNIVNEYRRTGKINFEDLAVLGAFAGEGNVASALTARIGSKKAKSWYDKILK